MVAHKRSFLHSLNAGRESEVGVINLLRDAGIECDINEAKGLSEKATHDVRCVVGGCEATLEVKRDLYEAKSGNLAIEHRNLKSGKPSGLTATTAQLWVVVLSDNSAWICRTSDLRRLHAKGEDGAGWFKEVKKCGDSNSSITLYRSDELRETLFFRIDTLPAGELVALLEVLVDTTGVIDDNVYSECRNTA